MIEGSPQIERIKLVLYIRRNEENERGRSFGPIETIKGGKLLLLLLVLLLFFANWIVTQFSSFEDDTTRYLLNPILLNSSNKILKLIDRLQFYRWNNPLWKFNIFSSFDQLTRIDETIFVWSVKYWKLQKSLHICICNFHDTRKG